jgi:hypothetical protein
MFRWYGFLGIILIGLTELNFIFKIQPFANYYFIFIWVGYILLMDAIVYKLKKNSLMSNRRNQLLGMFLLSAVIWWIFEFINIRTGNWGYNQIWGIEALAGIIRKSIYFSTVLPAIFETVEMIRSIHLFDKEKLKKSHKISKTFLHIMIGLGVITFLLPLAWPKHFYPLVWLCFFLLLDPINYLHKQPSIIGHLKDKRLVIPLSLLLAGIVCGFLWEFWNYWAVTKWVYEIPYFGFFKIFEMPILGYLGYLPFALELYAMYYFVRSLFNHKEHLLED